MHNVKMQTKIGGGCSPTLTPFLCASWKGSNFKFTQVTYNHILPFTYSRVKVGALKKPTTLTKN